LVVLHHLEDEQGIAGCEDGDDDNLVGDVAGKTELGKDIHDVSLVISGRSFFRKTSWMCSASRKSSALA